MDYSIPFHELLEFLADGLWAVVSGRPWTANIPHNLLIAANVDVVDIGTTSNHLLPAWTTPWNGPAKSMWSRVDGSLGNSHGCNGAGGGVACVS